MNILLVDDHPMTVEGFRNALLQVNLSNEETVFTKAYNCKDCYDIILNRTKNLKPFAFHYFCYNEF